MISGKPHTLSAVVTRRGSAVKTGMVGFYSGGSLLCFDTDGSDGWSCTVDHLTSWHTGQSLIAKYEQYSWGSGVTNGPARVGVGDLLAVSDFTLTLSDGQTSGTNVDRIPLGADTVRLTRDGRPLSLKASDDVVLNRVYVGTPTLVGESGAGAVAPQVTVDGDDHRITISTPTGTTAGTWRVRLWGQTLNGPSASVEVDLAIGG